MLADNVACALEKQQLRLIPARRTEMAGTLALTVGGAFVPGLGFAGLSMSASEAVMRRRDEEQSGRVSLVLLQDAGFDLDEAPKTWWLLSAKNKPQGERNMPYRAKYLYRILGTSWVSRSPGLSTSLPTA